MPSGLSYAELTELFPFMMAMDEELRVASMGPSLQRSLPDLQIGETLHGQFILERPAVALDATVLRRFDRSLILLRHERSGMQLKGQLLVRDKGFLLLCSPWVTTQAEVADLGLTLTDFAVHDPVVDYLMVLHARDRTVAELDELAGTLRERGKRLTEANKRLGFMLALTDLLSQDLPLEELASPMLEAVGEGDGWSSAEARVLGGPPRRIAAWGAVDGGPFDELIAEAERQTLEAPHVARVGGSDGGARTLAMRVPRPEQGDILIMLRREQAGDQAFIDRLAMDIQSRLQSAAQKQASSRALQAATDSAKAADRAKTDLLTMISHELRTPVHGIQGLAELACQAGDELERRAHMARLKQSAETLNRVVTDLLDVPLLEAGQLALTHQAFDPALVAEEAGGVLRSGVALEQLSPYGQPHLLGDPGRLRQVLVNLLARARQRTPNGAVRLDVRTEELGEGQVLLRAVVHDGTPNGQNEAPNLGLSSARALTERMGGELWISEPDAPGSAVVELRLQRAETQPPLAQLSGARVLLVHANARARALYAAALRRAGAYVEELGAGAQAVRTLREDACFHVVVIGDGLADLAAGALCGALRRVHPALSVVMLGGAPESEATAQLPASAGGAGLVVALVRLFRPTDAASLPESSLPPGSPRVLIVDDNIDNLRVAGAFLVAGGFQTGIAQGGREGIALFEQESWDMVLMDVEMPGVDGLEATRQMRAIESGRVSPRTPIVALTAHALESYRTRCLEAGMDDFVAKPVGREGLVAVARQWTR